MLSETKAQKEALKIIAANRITLLEGGARAGKTFIICAVILFRALKYPKTSHLIARFRFAHAKQSICYQTMPAVISALLESGSVDLNKTDWFYELPNKSKIWIGGLDDKERTEKILGNEYATIYLNEASQISYDSYETVLTRLNPPKTVPPKFLIDYNPPNRRHGIPNLS